MNLLPLWLRRRIRITRHFSRGGGANRLRLVPTESSRADRIPPAVDGIGLAPARQADARVGPPAGPARATVSGRREASHLAVVELAGRPDQVVPQRLGRDRRGRGMRQVPPASASTDGSVPPLVSALEPPPPVRDVDASRRVLPSHVVRAGPATYAWPSLGPVPPSVGGRSSEAPTLNSQTPRPSPVKNQPRRHDNGEE